MSFTPKDSPYEDLLRGVPIAASLLPKDTAPAPAASEPAAPEPMDVAALPKRPEITADLIESQPNADYAIVEQGGSYYMVRKSKSLGNDEEGVALKDQNGQFYLNSNIREGKEPKDAFSALIEAIMLMINGQQVQGIKLDDAATQHVQQEVRAGRMSVLHSNNTTPDREGDIETGGLRASHTDVYDQNGQPIPGKSVSRPLTSFSSKDMLALDAREVGPTVTKAVEDSSINNTLAVKRAGTEPKEANRKYVAVRDNTGQIYYALVANSYDDSSVGGRADLSASGNYTAYNVELNGKKLPLKAMNDAPEGEYLKVDVGGGKTAYLELIPADAPAARAMQLSDVTPLELNNYSARDHSGELLLGRERQKDPSTGRYKELPAMPDSFNAESLTMFEQGNAVGGKKNYGRALETQQRESFSQRYEDDSSMGRFFANTESGQRRALEDATWQSHDPDAALVAEQRTLKLPEGTKRVTIDYRTGTISASASESSGNVYKWNLADVGNIDFSNVTYSVGVQFKGQTQGRQLPAFSGLESLEHASVSGLKTQYGEQLSPGYGNMPMLGGDVAGVMGNAFGEAAEKNNKMAERRQQREAEREMLAEMKHQNYFMRQVMKERIRYDTTQYRMNNEGTKIGAAVTDNNVAMIKQAGQHRLHFRDQQHLAGIVGFNHARNLPLTFGLQGAGGQFAQGGFGQQGGFGNSYGQSFGGGGFSQAPMPFGQEQGAHNLPPQVVQMLQQQQQQIASLQSQIAAIGGAPNQPGAGSPVSYEVAHTSSPGNGPVRRT